MIPRLKWIWQSLWASLWAIPLIMVGCAAAMAIVASHIRIGTGSDPVWFLYSGDAADASQFLSNLMSAMITMATLAISITMVVLTLAAQQLGPRLIGIFVSDRRTQCALGLFIGTVVYLMLVLRSSYGVGDTAPNLAITGGTALALLSVLTLLLFVHHLAQSVVADNVIRRIGKNLDQQIKSLLPDPDQPPHPPRPASIRSSGAPVRAASSGYVQAVDFTRIRSLAVDADVMIELDVRPGHHILADSVIGWVEPHPRAGDELCETIGQCIIVGPERTPLQDLEYSIRQLVEIGVRALSPGINDPFTAIAVVDRLCASLREAMRRAPAQNVWSDESGRIRMIVPVSTFDGIVDAAFLQLRQLSSEMPALLIRMIDNLGELIALSDAERRPTLIRHVELVRDAGRRDVHEPADLASIEERANAALAQAGVTSSPAG